MKLAPLEHEHVNGPICASPLFTCWRMRRFGTNHRGLVVRTLSRLDMDGPVAASCGAVVIAAWSYGLVRDTSAVFLDMNPDRNMAERMWRSARPMGIN